MSQTSDKTNATSATSQASAEPAGKGSRTGAKILLGLIAGSLLWYFVSDRITPYSSQARVQAYVVPVVSQVSGTVQNVYVKNNDLVKPGQVLFDIDSSQYQITLRRSQSDYESVRRSVNASVAAVASAQANVQAAKANYSKAEKDATRQEKLYAEDPGAISVRRLEISQANRIQALSQVNAAEADLQRAIENAGDSGDSNAQLLSARASVEKAELDLKNTKVVAPSSGVISDLQVDMGNYAQVGKAEMTLIAIHDMWINADMTENNLGNVDLGDEAAIVLDAFPGKVLKGRVRSIGNGISHTQQAQPGTLPTIDNSRDWLRQAQRFPVAIEIDASERKHLKGFRVGGQAEVMVYTDDNFLMNFLGASYIRLMSLLSYLY